jgi:hypothetical protein
MDSINSQENAHKEFLPLINDLDGATLDEKLRISLALILCLKKLVPIEDAAKFSGQSPSHFVELFRTLTAQWTEKNLS